jgi:hypothetical protein
MSEDVPQVGQPSDVAGVAGCDQGGPLKRRLLIVHADDLGMTHSVNAAVIKAFELGAVTSGSIMVPCPWFPEIAEYGRSHAGLDLGVHLTLTSERSIYRWGPVASKDKVPTLLDHAGYFHKTPADAAARLDPDQAEAEMRAQIERALAFGIQPTHLDSHQLIHYSSPPLFKLLTQLGHEYHVPILLAKALLHNLPQDVSSILAPDKPVLDRFVMIGSHIPTRDWNAYYTSAIRALPIGISQLTIHPAYDDSEMRAATSDRPTWGAAWRQRDLDYITSSAFEKALYENAIRLVNWREIARREVCVAQRETPL